MKVKEPLIWFPFAPSNLASSPPSLISMQTSRMFIGGFVIELHKASDQVKSSMEHSSTFSSRRV